MDSRDVCYYRSQFQMYIAYIMENQYRSAKKVGLMVNPIPPKGKHYIFRRYRKCPKTGIILDARKYHVKAWPILVDDNNPNPE